jgi:hypothetical protein
MISEGDLNLFQSADDVDTAFQILTEGLKKLYLTPDAEITDTLG